MTENRGNRYRPGILIQFFLLLIANRLLSSQVKGTIEGSTVDGETRKVLAGVHLLLLPTGIETRSDGEGLFRFAELPSGTYRLQASLDGFVPLARSDIVVRPKRITRLRLELNPLLPELCEEVTVSGSYFQTDDKAPASVFHVDNEEMRRTPGVYGDVNRMVRMMPGTLNAGDTQNDLIVRGGSPVESGVVLNRMEIPNINHFSSWRSSGGRFSTLNPGLIEEIDFYSGNYPSQYGERLSSILEIKLREGNGREFDGQFDVNIGGAGLILEGPLPGKKGSWLASYRRSYLMLLEKTGIVSLEEYVPFLEDAQAHIVLSAGERHRLSLTGLYGRSRYHIDEGGQYKEYNSLQYTGGLNWQYLWRKNGYSETSVFFSRLANGYLNRDLLVPESGLEQESRQSDTLTAFRSDHFWRITPRIALLFGMQGKWERLENEFFSRPELNDASWRHQNRFAQAALYGTIRLNPVPRLTINLGGRIDYSGFSRYGALSPRISLHWRWTPRLGVYAGFGQYRQSLAAMMPLFIWTRETCTYPDPRSRHWVIGCEYFPGPDTRFTIEVYDKEYDRLPLSPDYPELLLSDRKLHESALLPERIESTGIAFGRGVELFFQKKPVRGFFGISSLAVAQSRYRDLAGQWRDRGYDARIIFNLILGFRPGKRWELSGRWTYASGLPMTPFDVERSFRLNRAVVDLSRTNGERLPAYSLLNLRAEKRFVFKGSSLSLYLEIWNLLNRKHVFYYYWNRRLRAVAPRYELPRLPFFGLEYEF